VINVELRKAIADFFDAGDFAEFIGVDTAMLIDAFEDEVEEALPDIQEMMGLHSIGDAEEEE
jgi:hypothetical protein